MPVLSKGLSATRNSGKDDNNDVPLMAPIRWLLLVLLAWGFSSPMLTSAQRASNWRVYRASDGLVESFTTAVTLSVRGNIWLQHGDAESLSLLDGYEVFSIPAPHPRQSRVLETPAGQVWAISPDGLQEFRNGSWRHYVVPEIQSQFRTNIFRQLRPFSFLPLEQDRVLFLVPAALMEFSAASRKSTVILAVEKTGLQRFTEMISSRDGGLWICGMQGAVKVQGPLRTLKSDLFWKPFLVEDAAGVYEIQRPFEDAAGGLTGVAESRTHPKRVVVSLEGERWNVHVFPGENPRQAWRDDEGRLWVCSINSLFFLDGETKRTIERDEIAAGQYFDVAREPSGAFWLATSEGLFRHGPMLWQRPAPAPGGASTVHSILQDAQNRLWFADARGLTLFQEGKWSFHSYPEDLEKYFQPTDSIFSMGNNQLLMDGGNRLLRFRVPTRRFDYISHPAQARLKPLGVVAPGLLALVVWEPGGPVGAFHLETFDGARFHVLEEQPDFKLGNELNFLFVAQNGDWWLGGNGGVARLRQGKWKMFKPGVDGAPDSAFCIVETVDGAIWVGLRDRIVQWKEKDWSLVRAGFDRVNSLKRNRDGSVWAASNNGLFRFHNNLWMAHGIEEGLPSLAIHDLLEERSGAVWAGTTRGVARYQPLTDPDPPKTFIERVRNEPNNFSDGAATLRFSGRDKWKVTPMERLLYGSRLDGQEWSAYSEERSVSFSDLAAGKHQFQVRTIDRNWNVDPAPASFEFSVILPWYRDARSLSIAIFGLALALFFAALAFNRHRKLVRSYAEVEKIVSLRTRQLEQANKELLQSQKMTALGTLAAGVAHDFNNILSIIKGSAQIIEANLENPEKVRTRIGRIKTVVEQGAGIVRGMLGFGRPSEKTLGPCDINQIVEDTLKLLGDQFQRQIEVSFARTENLPRIRGSQDYIQQMLLNLIFNAQDALSGHGKIIIATGQKSRLPPELSLAPPPAESHVYVSVQDFGSGIAPEILPRIFEPFFTTKVFSARRGTGLGLSMVYELARELGFGLAVESTLERGSMFTVFMPALPAAVSAT